MKVYAGVPERTKGVDSRSSGVGLQGFESLPLHSTDFSKALILYFKVLTKNIPQFIFMPFFPPARDANAPNKLKTANIVNDILVLVTNSG